MLELLVTAWALLWPLQVTAQILIAAGFETGPAPFAYLDDAFRGTAQPAYASGVHLGSGGFAGGALSVTVGGVDGADILDMSGGWEASFVLDEAQPVQLSLRYRLIGSESYESDERIQALVSLDGALLGTGPDDFLVEIAGNGNGGAVADTGWIAWSAHLGNLPAGTHALRVGGYGSKKTFDDESVEVRFDDVRVELAPPPAPEVAVQSLVAALDPARFRASIETLAGLGSRHWSQQGNLAAVDWIETQLASYGYTVERHAYTFDGETRENVYATRTGSLEPDRMYIVSAHLDSTNNDSADRSFAPGADDDASGVALVLEAARVLASPGVEVERSVRFAFWNNEETGLAGSAAYAADRAPLQGVESPPGSGLFPEPTWLGMLQHDMILFDHGLPPQPQQIPGADIDIEYQLEATSGGGAIALALAVLQASSDHASDYPAQVSGSMSNTDSRSFQDHAPAISLRENQRLAEIGNGANPHWHRDTDVPGTYSDADYLLGFNVVQTSVAAVARLAGARVAICGNGVLEAGEACDDGGTAPGDCCAADCALEPAGSGCDDGDACTSGDVCGAGTCQPGPPLLCDDAEACTTDACDAASGCTFLANTDPCDDGDACTSGDVCGAGTCQPGPPLLCDDAEACTEDVCEPALGCVHEPIEMCVEAPGVPLLPGSSPPGVALPLLLLGALLWRARSAHLGAGSGRAWRRRGGEA